MASRFTGNWRCPYKFFVWAPPVEQAGGALAKKSLYTFAQARSNIDPIMILVVPNRSRSLSARSTSGLRHF